uniref:Uncharacterized protein n=1 Tax=Rhizophora mucronata TaxID=61149 RepID=A0A2P2IK54_RHIMU
MNLIWLYLMRLLKLLWTRHLTRQIQKLMARLIRKNGKNMWRGIRDY